MSNKKFRDVERNKRKNTIQDKEFKENEEIKIERKIKKSVKKKRPRNDRLKTGQWIEDLLDEEYEEIIEGDKERER